MDTRNLNNLVSELCDAITFLAKAIPKRSVRTWIELLFGAMMTQRGFVTDAYLSIRPGRHWNTYFKWLQKGRWSWVALGLQTARLILRLCPQGRVYLPLDDTVVFRSSRRAPEAKVHHQHGNKTNRPRFVLGQNWVTLAIALSLGSTRTLALPILSRLARTTGNAGKLAAAKTLLRVCRSLFAPYAPIVLLDCWYMRRSLIQCAQAMGYHVLGQVRKDTALHFLPGPRPAGKRGRPRKYGAKCSADRVSQLPLAQIRVFVYGAWHTAYYRSEVVLARFLRGQKVRAVWVTLEKDNGPRSPQRLLLCTDLNLSAEEILRAYCRRWAIEDLFNQLKNRWGWKETWQQSRQVLHRWVQILSTGYALPQLFVYKGLLAPNDVGLLYPWRYRQPPTAGMVRDLIARIFSHVDLRALWDARSEKFVAPKLDQLPQQPPDLRKAA